MKLGFIGVGKIAGAVIEALCTSKMGELSVSLSPRNSEKADKLASRFSNVKKQASNQEVIDNSDIIFIALRPADAQSILSDLRFDDQKTVVSFIPYLTHSELAEAVKHFKHISRAIPLPTVVHHNCPIPVFNPDKTVKTILDHIGQPLEVKSETELHSIWTLTGLITPFYELMGALSQWTHEHGVDRDTTNQYVSDLFESLAYAAQKAEVIDFEELADHAATPNGMNEQAGKEIREKGAHEIYRQASDNLLAKFMKNL
ncbi:NAD(P)-binding domain-containing protein [Leptobacterium flavescens]|uniref:NAD(P)-binding domain-containing protein n=1 Tax=Leptobacterium flavescens TaxID=472055 RepID=A0A6P0UI89_9FLAO|nr:NAD(P)-binding domain-containing protein [Leptobacterium flavescens]NER12707.1 NAD(P)-binding domain-containing protein [Leptobacterium flavescens]